MGAAPLRARICGTVMRPESFWADMGATSGLQSNMEGERNLARPSNAPARENPALLGAVRPVSRAIRPVEADRIGKAQRRGAGGRAVIARKVNPLDHVKPAAVEEHVDGQTALVRTLDATGDALEPGA